MHLLWNKAWIVVIPVRTFAPQLVKMAYKMAMKPVLIVAEIVTTLVHNQPATMEYGTEMKPAWIAEDRIVHHVRYQLVMTVFRIRMKRVLTVVVFVVVIALLQPARMVS